MDGDEVAEPSRQGSRRQLKRRKKKPANKRLTNFLYDMRYVGLALAIGLPLLALLIYATERF